MLIQFNTLMRDTKKHKFSTHNQTDIHCSELATPNNGNVVLSDPTLLVGTIATYNCNQGYVLAGDTKRSCKEGSDRTIGTWNGTMPSCEGKKNSRRFFKYCFLIGVQLCLKVLLRHNMQ